METAHDCMALHISLPSSLYDLNNVERDVKHQTIIFSMYLLDTVYIASGKRRYNENIFLFLHKNVGTH